MAENPSPNQPQPDRDATLRALGITRPEATRTLAALLESLPDGEREQALGSACLMFANRRLPDALTERMLDAGAQVIASQISLETSPDYGMLYAALAGVLTGGAGEIARRTDPDLHDEDLLNDADRIDPNSIKHLFEGGIAGTDGEL